MSLTQFLGLLIPLYRDDPQQRSKKPTEDSDETRHKQLDRLDESIRDNYQEARRLLDLESVPFRLNEPAKAELNVGLNKFMLDNVVNAREEVRNAMGESVRRRRMGVPAGARGNR